MFKVLQKPENFPVSLELVKSYLRIQHDDEDDLLEHLIRSASEWIQESTGKSLLRQTCQFLSKNQRFFLPYGPVLEIREVKFRGKVLKSDQYHLDPLEGSLTLNLPVARRSGLKVDVTYDAGYGDKPEDVPEAIRNAVLTAIAYLYENRDNAENKVSLNQAIKPWVQYHKEYHLV